MGLVKRALTLLAIGVLGACGTYSTMRPAPVLPPGHVELGAGLAANGIGEVNVVLDGHVGILPRVEIGGHYEIYSGFVEARVQLLEEQAQGVSLSVSAGGGFGTTLIDEVGEAFSEAQDPDPAFFTGLAVSRRFAWVEPYLAGRFAVLFGKGLVTAPVAGLALHAGRHVIFVLEGGAAIHTREGASLGIGQGALGLGLRF